ASLKTSVFRDDPLKKACFTACRTGNCKGTSKNNQFFEVPKTNKIVLYAPTYRGEHLHPKQISRSILLDSGRILEALTRKFDANHLFLYRTHYYTDNSEIINNTGCNTNSIISASEYPDMQELLCAADILITDYSSSIWDFSFTFKPCFLFAPDVEEYKTQQGFYTPIEEWPFSLAKTNEELVDNINRFDSEKYRAAVKDHHRKLGAYEQGTAAKQFCDLLFGDLSK
ncbi:MAG: CDP-glycerol glycerophosphotransferase family protein, partial [Bacteroidales bacterium]|nr:CDP-glycerol glycerophosphotransferase family protein [Bacteroidales bacterium]